RLVSVDAVFAAIWLSTEARRSELRMHGVYCEECLKPSGARLNSHRRTLCTGSRVGLSAATGPRVAMMKFFFSEAATRPGQVGLKNLGNSCFMAAGLQCLSHLEPLVEFCLSGQVLEELNPHHRGLAKAFADLQKDIWFPGNQGVLDPSSLHRKLADLAPHLFEAYDQQDVQEFLAFCLDGLHEDLNRVIVAKPTSEA
ncbi:unnamed protein product, partial [Effrenium voratum]